MKKIIFLFVAVMFAGLLTAQHTDVVYQNGYDNSSVITQEFVGSGTSYDGNAAYVDQIGDYNKSTVYQNNNAYAGSAEFADVYQKGNKNIASVDQTNDGHKAWIVSIGNENQAYIMQRCNKTKAEIYQYGNKNYGRIYEWGVNGTWGYIYQKGYKNTSTQDLGSNWVNAVENSSFYARQVGNYNSAKQILHGEGWPGGILAHDNTGTIYQYGDNNIGEQLMYEDVTFYAFKNMAYLYQNGNWNTSYQWMKRDNNASTITQLGNSNYSMSKQNW